MRFPTRPATTPVACLFFFSLSWHVDLRQFSRTHSSVRPSFFARCYLHSPRQCARLLPLLQCQCFALRLQLVEPPPAYLACSVRRTPDSAFYLRRWAVGSTYFGCHLA